MKPFKNQTITTTKAQSLMEAIAAIQTASEARAFLEDLCTPAELQAMQDRWNVVKPLKAGVPYREIAKASGVSVTTIGRVARCLTQGSGGYQLIFTRLDNQSLNES